MENSFPERIEAEIRRGEIDSQAAEDIAQMEAWLAAGAPAPGTPARRLRDRR